MVSASRREVARSYKRSASIQISRPARCVPSWAAPHLLQSDKRCLEERPAVSRECPPARSPVQVSRRELQSRLSRQSGQSAAIGEGSTRLNVSRKRARATSARLESASRKWTTSAVHRKLTSRARRRGPSAAAMATSRPRRASWLPRCAGTVAENLEPETAGSVGVGRQSIRACGGVGRRS